MKACKALSYVFAVVGILLVICAVLGRFIDSQTVFGNFIPDGGMAATSVMLGADTFLLLAILAYLYKKE
jgi:hypothetical protein